MKFARATLILLTPLLCVFGVIENSLAQAADQRGGVGGELLSVPTSLEQGANLSPLGQVERRLLVCEERLARWRGLAALTASPELAARRPSEWAGCYANLEGLVGGYRRLLELVGQRRESGLDTWQVLAGDIAFLEGECPQVYRRVSDLTSDGGPGGVSPGQTVAATPGSPVVGPPPQLGEPELLEAWNKAGALFDAGKYEETIVELAVLVNTSYSAVAKEKILKAQTEVAKQLRTQAAGLFVKARKSDVSAQKKKLLEESWALLNKIVTTYPEIAIIDKVKQNLSQIEEQLEELDPALLHHLRNPIGEKG